VQLRDVVAVSTGENQRERDALRFGDEVVLGAGANAIGVEIVQEYYDMMKSVNDSVLTIFEPEYETTKSFIVRRHQLA
jgi:hypothetical protein